MKLSKEARRRIEDEMDTLVIKMSDMDVPQDYWIKYKTRYDEYNQMLRHNWKISPDTLLVVAGNLLGILLILNFEKVGILNTKALNFVLKGRV